MRIGRILLVLGALFVIIILIVWGFRALFGSNDTKQSSTTATQQALSLTDYNGTGTVTFIQDGKIVAPENHYQILISVNASSRIVTVYNGYVGTVVTTQTFTNDQPSFNSFMAALQQAGYLNTKTSEPASATREGSCATGVRYSYQLSEGATSISDTWSTSCNLKTGTFGGSSGQVRQLFQAQIPNYSTITSKAKM